MIISCPECEKAISDQADSCSYCGYPINTSTAVSDAVHAAYRDRLEEQGYKSSWALETSIGAIATGALVLSVALMKDYGSYGDLAIMRTSWILLLAAIIFQLMSHWTSARAMEKQKDIADQASGDACNPWTFVTRMFNIIYRAAFVLGLLGIVVYAFLNVGLADANPRESRNRTNNRTNAAPINQGDNNGWSIVQNCYPSSSNQSSPSENDNGKPLNDPVLPTEGQAKIDPPDPAEQKRVRNSPTAMEGNQRMAKKDKLEEGVVPASPPPQQPARKHNGGVLPQKPPKAPEPAAPNRKK